MKLFLAFLIALVWVPAFAQYNNDKAVSPAAEKQNISKLLKNHSAIKAAFKKNPKDAKLKKKYVDSNVALGMQYTYSNTVDRKQKYRIALGYFNEALKYDPKNKDATETRNLIVSIYRSMGRPVPGESGKGG
jgi:tetratricopeptide (TPR) repeat protein